MAALLPSRLICLTIRHVINDPDAVEGLLAENSNATACLPAALKEAFNMPTVPDASATYKYLRTLWDATFMSNTTDLDAKRLAAEGTAPFLSMHDAYTKAASNGATYLLDYVTTTPDQQMVYFAMVHAASTNEVGTLMYLLDRFYGAGAPVPSDVLNSAVNANAVKSVRAILDRGIADYNGAEYTPLSRGISDYNGIEYILSADMSPNLDSLRLLLAKLPRNDKVKEGINEALIKYAEHIQPSSTQTDEYGNALDQAGRLYNVRERNHSIVEALRLLLENGAQTTDTFRAYIRAGNADDIFMATIRLLYRDG